ncbi:MAG: hypothetical protein KGL39_06640 [Patescibacteria group bacterium]|nr:hypothetical protein [Patescibacteria group bacterium]
MADIDQTRPGRVDGRSTNLGSRLSGLFNQCIVNRQNLEVEWLKDERQFKGIYEPDEWKRFKERDNCSKEFIRITRTKVETLNARIGDLVYGTGKKNWAIRPDVDADQPQTEGITDEVTDPQVLAARQAVQAQAKTIAAKAENMDQEIHGQLLHSRFVRLQRYVVNSGHKYGTGILKGPLATGRRVQKWAEVQKPVAGSDNAGPGSQATPSQTTSVWQVVEEDQFTPVWEAVRVWDFYPEMEGEDLANCEYVFQRHLFHKADILKLARNVNFYGHVIREHVEAHPDGDAQYMSFETELDAMGRYTAAIAMMRRRKYEVLEYWGPVSVEELRDMGHDIAEDVAGTIEAHVWMFRSTMSVFAADLNPIAKQERPYSFYTPFGEEGHLFGESFPSIIRDPQRLYNSYTRMMADNSASAVIPQVELDVSRVPSAKNLTAMPAGRIWPVEPDPYGNNNRAINFSEFPNHAQIYLMARQATKADLDETSGVPAYQQGGNPGAGAGRTASGLSMLMGAAGLLLKNQLFAWDEFQARVLTLAYDWNMQYNPRRDIKGSFKVHVVGSMSLAMKEMRAEQVKNFRLSTNNPEDNKWVKRRELLWAEAEENDLDPSRLIKTKQELMQETQELQAEQAKAAMDPIKQMITKLSLGKQIADIINTMSQANMADAKAGGFQGPVMQELMDLLSSLSGAAAPPPAGGGQQTPGGQPAAMPSAQPAEAQPPMPPAPPGAPGPAQPTQAASAASGGESKSPMQTYIDGLLHDAQTPQHYA